MDNHNLVLHDNTIVTPCPECGNNTKYHASTETHSEEGQKVTDVFVACVCGYDPTFFMLPRHRLVDGDSDETSVERALEKWNQAISDNKETGSTRRCAEPDPLIELMILEREQDFLAGALQDVYKEAGEEYSYQESLDALIWMAKTTPEKFMEILPELRRRSETEVRFEI